MKKKKVFSVYQIISSVEDQSEPVNPEEISSTGSLSEATKLFNQSCSAMKKFLVSGYVQLNLIQVEDHGKKWFVLRLADQTGWCLENKQMRKTVFENGVEITE